jgi:cytochrome c biogenesis protein CcmG, thiol:disulfide interchange protein DsbE
MRAVLFCGVLLLASYLAVAQKQNGVEAANAKSLSLVGKPAPTFTLLDFNQQSFSLADRQSQVIVLAFWATWCPPCRSEMPLLARLQKELATEGVTIIPVAFDDPAKAKGFLTKRNVAIWSLLDPGGDVAAVYGAHALPKTFVINRSGLVAKTIIGKLSEVELRNAVQAARR